MITPPKKLVIIDYCGTLSLEASRFGRPENLVRVLQESGLAALGVSTPEAFWSDIVNPSWVEGSTTATGYARVMADRIASRGFASSASAGEIEAAASRFVAVYLDSSRIDPGWRPILTRLSKHSDIITVIATDHYAEATGKITDYLDLWGIPAIPVLGVTFAQPDRERNPQAPPFGGEKGRTKRTCLFLAGKPCPTDRELQRRYDPDFLSAHGFLVANSAGLGVWKQDRRFWEILRAQLPPAPVRRILLIDDFGFNEVPGDSYGERAKVMARRVKTVANLGETFRAVVEVAPFDMPGEGWGSEEAGAGLIAETAARIDAFLEKR